MRVIAGTARSTPLLTREGRDTRPTADRVKEGLFNAIQFEIEGRDVLDLFGGSGQLAIEALSRGARSAVITDASAQAVGVIEENLRRTRLADRAQVIRTDYMDYLQKCEKKFQIIFLDPPYAENFLENALKRISEIDILSSGGIIITERPVGKVLEDHYSGLVRQRDYRYGKTVVTLFRRSEAAP
ncbi:MAG: 16S rRNA (guanine(966)-N(2))-methyltransferase RsmD [Candidatus Faecousia sp.]|nr:16S rRNA (guanine(966)-N(2))-methyltransferase RsmD [Candidatus Faecousia sp.]